MIQGDNISRRACLYLAPTDPSHKFKQAHHPRTSWPVWAGSRARPRQAVSSEQGATTARPEGETSTALTSSPTWLCVSALLLTAAQQSTEGTCHAVLPTPW